MYPTKSMFDYITEMKRLFPRSNENDMFQSPPTPNTSLRSFNQSMAPSSSSTDTSPDSFPDMTPYRIPSETFQHQYERQREHLDNQYEFQRQQYERQVEPMHEIPFAPSQMYETPFMVRRQRPIVGRKIISEAESQIPKMDHFSNVWSEETSSLPNTCMEQQYNQNAFYELFPSENMKTEFKTPVKTSPNSFKTSPKMTNESLGMASSAFTNMSPRMTQISPRMTQMSPSMTQMSPRMTETSPRMTQMNELPQSRKTSPGSHASYSPGFSTQAFKEPIVGLSTSFRPNTGSKMCTFCRKNGETPCVYMTHMVKEKFGNKNVVTCPILRSHVCGTCGASGDNAHTITYCPVLRSTNNGQPLQSTTITLKNTRVKSNGRRRY